MHMSVLSVALAVAMTTSQIPSENLTNGFALGCQAWSFNRYTALEAIEKTASTGAKVIEFFPGQRVSKDFEGSMGQDMSAEAITAIEAQLAKFKIKPAAYGVTGIDRNEDGARKLFQWAKRMGIGILNTESTESIDTIEKMVKEFDIKVGFHNHPRQENNPGYKVWDPAYVLSLVKERDIRIGSCADTGHWVRSGIKPVDALRTLKGRIVSSHLKDLDVFAPQGHDVPFGTGVSDMRGILTELRAQGFKGSASIEYEHNWEASVPDIAQCVGFVRGLPLR